MLELETATNSLCRSGHFGSLYRVLKNLPGAYAVLVSDCTAEQKRRQLLLLLKQQAPGAGKAPRAQGANIKSSEVNIA